MAKFTIFRGSNNNYYFNLKADNGEKVLSSEGYVTKQSCQNGIASVRSNSQVDSRYQKYTSTNNQYYFTLTAENGQVIGRSELYTTTSSRDNGIAVVKRIAPGATVEDIS